MCMRLNFGGSRIVSLVGFNRNTPKYIFRDIFVNPNNPKVHFQGYYVNLLKTISLKLNETTVQFFFHEEGASGAGHASFPLYTGAGWVGGSGGVGGGAWGGGGCVGGGR